MKYLIATFAFVLILTGCGRTQDPGEGSGSAGDSHLNPASDADPPLNYSRPLSDLLDSLSITGSGIHIRIDKSNYLLSVMADSLVIKQYPVVFGGNPVDDKLRQGDNCTPEGRFRVRSKYPHRSWDKFIWIDYPTEDSWRRHRQAKLEGIIDESAEIGGQIGIHGVPRGTGAMIDLRVNWTLGCISLKNKDINDFYPYVHTGTLVIIEK